MKTMDEFPAKLDDIIRFSCNIDSLIKIIQLLHKNNTDLGMTVQDLTRRISKIDKINEDFTQVTLKIQAHERQFYEVEESLNNHSKLIMELDSKVGEASKTSKTSVEKINLHEENINNLNRVVEEHIKSAKAQEEKITLMQQNLNENTIEIKNKKVMDTRMSESISNLSIDIRELKDSFDLKVIDIDKTFTNLISSIGNRGGGQDGENFTPTSSSFKRSNTTNLGTSANDYLVKLALDDIDKLTKKAEETEINFNDVRQQMKYNNEINEQERDAINKQIEHLKDKINMTQSLYQEMQMSPSDNNKEDDQTKNEINCFGIRALSKYEESQKNLYDLYYQLRESISVLGNHLEHKISKDELKDSNNLTMIKIEHLSNKLHENLILTENKFKKLAALAGGDGDGSSNIFADFDFITQTLEKEMNENIKRISLENIKKLILEGDIASNPAIARLISHVNKHTEELNESYKSIVDIRSILSSHDVIEDINDIKARLRTSEEEYRRMKYNFEEFKKSLEEDEQPDPIKHTTVMSLLPRQATISSSASNVKGSITSLTNACKEINDKVQALEKKHNQITNEIRESIKNSLKTETERVIEQFQKNLNSFTNKFEYQLKNKIDQIGLSSFEYKINNRLTSEMKSKLDQKDMKKNNHVINRKLDSLENKISKTLVDTIIDLQMDEAPLIVKKNNRNEETCASCNQSLPQTTYLRTSENVDSSGVMNKMKTSRIYFNKDKDKDKDKDKLPDIE